MTTPPPHHPSDTARIARLERKTEVLEKQVKIIAAVFACVCAVFAVILLLKSGTPTP